MAEDQLGSGLHLLLQDGLPSRHPKTPSRQIVGAVESLAETAQPAKGVVEKEQGSPGRTGEPPACTVFLERERWVLVQKNHGGDAELVLGGAPVKTGTACGYLMMNRSRWQE